MLCYEHLDRLRHFELDASIAYLTPGARVLEIGGGSGVQASMLSQRGFDVESIDVDDSQYKEHRVYPVTTYDGKHIPFEDDSFDVVYSSNVLEHVVDLGSVQAEIRRVLKPNGYAVHIMPSPSWRLWTSIAHYFDMVGHLGRTVRQIAPAPDRPALRVKYLPGSLLKTFLHQAIPPRHGEVGNVLTEHWTFSRSVWKAHFRRHGYRVELAKPMGLFYTGHMVFGPRWSFGSRQKFSKLLGSACSLYKVTVAAGSTRS